MGVAWWEGQSSRGQECTFSSFARSPLEYKFATLSPWRETLSLSPPPAIPVGLYATSSTPETSSNNLQPLGMDFEFLDTPLPSHSPSDSPTTRLPIYSFAMEKWSLQRVLSNASMETCGENLISVSVSTIRPDESKPSDFHPHFTRIRVTYVRMYVIVSRYRGYVREPTLSRIKREDYCRRLDGKSRCEDTIRFRIQ